MTNLLDVIYGWAQKKGGRERRRFSELGTDRFFLGGNFKRAKKYVLGLIVVK